jgi:probable phosphoglycerate mutase
MLRIFLIRHGETEWSLSGRHTSRTDLPLTARGEANARWLGRRLQDLAFSAVLTSPRLRARQTCEAAGLGASAAVEADLAEWDYGDYEGRTTAEISLTRPGWDLFHDGCPGGETPDRIAVRADAVVARLRARDGNVAVFSHGHFLRVLTARWAGFPVSAARNLLLNTASLSILGYEHGASGQPVIALLNEDCGTPGA